MSTEEEQFMALMHESLRAQKDCASIVINYTCYNAHYDYVDTLYFTFNGDDRIDMKQAGNSQPQEVVALPDELATDEAMRLWKKLHAKINAIERILEDLENNFRKTNGSGIDYIEMVNLDHCLKLKRNSIFNFLLKNSHGNIKKSLSIYICQLKDEFKNLRNYLTQTNADNSTPKDITIRNNKATYSKERTNCILASINLINIKLLDVKVLVNKM